MSPCIRSGAAAFRSALLCLALYTAWVTENTSANESPSLAANSTVALSEKFAVRSYLIHGSAQFLTNAPGESFFARYTGPEVSLSEIVNAAGALQSEYRDKGLVDLSIAFAPEKITNGVLAMHLFRGGHDPQIVISGRPYTEPSKLITSPTKTKVPPTESPASQAATNAGPRFKVKAYAIAGNTLLSEASLTSIFTKYTGTNIGVPEILKAAGELQTEYRERAYPTVNVTVPPQQITNEIVKIEVFEGVLSKVEIVNNHYFSSNNIMRALPSLKPGLLLNSRVFQAELDRANANQDRQIYPQIEPGPEEGTTDLRLKVEDRLPLHAKIELNNQNSPGTPELRVNSSAVYNNLWQQDHSLGVQYNFSPEKYKPGEQWEFYDQPLVANYSGFYRLPLTTQQPVADAVNSNPGAFGFDEATRRFRLPPPSGRAELNLFASRSTIDTDILTLSERKIEDIPGALSITERDVQQDITINNDLGARMSLPWNPSDDFRSGFSWGFDYKEYALGSFKTNLFLFDFITVNPNGTTNPPVTSTDISAVPATHRALQYFPLAIRYDGTLRDKFGSTAFGLGISGNAWHSGSSRDVQIITLSDESSGHWIVLTPSIARDFVFRTNWVLSVRADGQWASEPLINNEQFGAGGVNSVRGYHEGEVFGDEGWHLSIEQKTPPHVVGLVRGKIPLTIRGSIYMDYAEVYLLDPLGRQDGISLWGAGLGFVISLGTHWESRFLFSMPFERTPTTSPGQPRFDFGLTAQF